MIQACIFDLDGVIVDTAHYHYLAWQRLANELGAPFTLQDNERLKGVSRMRSLDIVLELGKITRDPEEKIKLADKKNQWFVEYVNRMKPEEVYQGVRQLLSNVRARGLKVGLASSSKNALTVIRLTKMESYFDDMVDGNMIKNTKPDPEIFLLAAKRLLLEPDQCLVFEDAEAGVEAARAAGMKCIGIGSKESLQHANVVIKNTGDFNLEQLDDL